MFSGPAKLDRILTSCIKRIEKDGWTIDDCLGRYSTYRSELEPMLRTALRIRRGQGFRPSVEFRRNAQRRMHARLQASRRSPGLTGSSDSMHLRGTQKVLPSGKQGLRNLQWAIPILLISVVIIGFGGSIAYAADHSKPGDALYRIDRAIEQFRINYENDSQQIVRLYLQFATERLYETNEMLKEGDTSSIELALMEYRNQIGATAPLINKAQAAGEDVRQLIQETSNTLSGHGRTLENLLEIAPIDVKTSIQVAIKDVEDILIVVVSPIIPTKPVVKLPPTQVATQPIYDKPKTATPVPPHPKASATVVHANGPTNTPSSFALPTSTVPQQATPTPIPAQATPTPTAIVYATPTPVITTTATPAPTYSITPTPTHTPTPTPTHTPPPPTNTPVHNPTQTPAFEY